LGDLELLMVSNKFIVLFAFQFVGHTFFFDEFIEFFVLSVEAKLLQVFELFLHIIKLKAIEE